MRRPHHSRWMVSPPSIKTTCPVEYAKSPRISDATAFPTSSGSAAGEIHVGRPLLNHPVCHRLRQEIRSLQVRAHHLLETFLGGFQDIPSFPRCHPGIVYQRMQSSKVLSNRCHHFHSRLALRHITRAIQDFGAELPQSCQGVADRAFTSQPAQGQVEPLTRQGLGDAETYSPSAAGNQCDPFHIMPSTPGSVPRRAFATTRCLFPPVEHPWPLPAASSETVRSLPRAGGTIPIEL
jgi:hypothetical protein